MGAATLTAAAEATFGADYKAYVGYPAQCRAKRIQVQLVMSFYFGHRSDDIRRTAFRVGLSYLLPATRTL